MNRSDQFRSLNRREPDRPGAAAEGKPDPTLKTPGYGWNSHCTPRWALASLARGEDVPGKVIPMYLRWHDTCRQCSQVIFVYGPGYLPPALHEIVPTGNTSDLEAFGRYSLEIPQNLIQVHPHPYYPRAGAWEELDTSINLGDPL